MTATAISRDARPARGVAVGRLYEMAFALYIGTGPIYWLPGVNLAAVGLLKTVLFIFLVLKPLGQQLPRGRLRFPGGRAAFLTVAIFFCLFFPGLVIGDPAASLYRLQNAAQIVLLLMACGCLIERNSLEFVVVLSVKIFLAGCALSLGLMALWPDYPNPLNDALQLVETGLGGSRTSWSPAIALYLPWLYAGAVCVSTPAIWMGIGVLFTNQVMVAGRTGMVAALIALFLFGVLGRNIKVLLAVLAALAVVGVLAGSHPELFRMSSGGLGSRADLDELSTGRLDGYSGALSEVAANPFIGVGSSGGDFSGVHNVVLKAAVEGGIPFALSLVWLIAFGLYRGYRQLNRANPVTVSAFLTVLSGCVNSLFEPVAMLGSFNNSAFWWVCFAVCVRVTPATGSGRATAAVAERS